MSKIPHGILTKNDDWTELSTVRVSRSQNKLHVSCVCTKCGRTSGARSLPENVTRWSVAEVFNSEGWVVDRFLTDSSCPDCELAAKHGVVEQKVVSMTRRSPGAIKAEREAFALLDEHFDTKAGQYKEEYTDQIVAAKVGLSLPMIVELREAAYGPIRIDKERDKLLKQCANIRSELALVQEQIANLLNRIIVVENDAKRSAQA